MLLGEGAARGVAGALVELQPQVAPLQLLQRLVPLAERHCPQLVADVEADEALALPRAPRMLEVLEPLRPHLDEPLVVRRLHAGPVALPLGLELLVQFAPAVDRGQQDDVVWAGSAAGRVGGAPLGQLLTIVLSVVDQELCNGVARGVRPQLVQVDMAGLCSRQSAGRL